MNIKMEEMPASVARFLSYKLSIQGASEKTVYEYGLDLCAFLRFVFRHLSSADGTVDLSCLSDKEIGEISTQQIYEYLLYTATVLKNGNAARARKLSAIKGFYKFLAHKEHAISENPAQHIDAPNVKHALPKFLSLEESKLLLAHKQISPVRDYFINNL